MIRGTQNLEQIETIPAGDASGRQKKRELQYFWKPLEKYDRKDTEQLEKFIEEYSDRASSIEELNERFLKKYPKTKSPNDMFAGFILKCKDIEDLLTLMIRDISISKRKIEEG